MSITPQDVVWAVLDTEINEIVDFGSCPLISEDLKVTNPVLLDLVSYFCALQ